MHCNIKPRGICKQTMPDLLTCSPRSHTNIWVLGKWDINGVRSDHMTKTIGGVLIEIWSSWGLRLKHIDFIQADPANGVTFEPIWHFFNSSHFPSLDTSPFWEAIGVCECVCACYTRTDSLISFVLCNHVTNVGIHIILNTFFGLCAWFIKCYLKKNHIHKTI